MGNRPIDEDPVELDRDPTDLDLLGIRISAPVGEAEVIGSWLVIGTLVATSSLIEAVPRRGLMEIQLAKLLAAATKVWLYGRAPLRGWVFQPELGWVVRVYMRQPSEERRLISSSRSCFEGLPPRMLAGLSRPSGR